MSHFICPVCGKYLSKNGKSLCCENKHSFDIAKSGYVNLLMSQQSKHKQHGDDKLMIRARSLFLDQGYYRILLSGILELIIKYTGTDAAVLDAGCGEGWYTDNINRYLKENRKKPDIFAVDISKDALTAAAKRCDDVEFAVASVYRLPIEDCSCDLILSLFAPFCRDEFTRVVKDGGIVIRVVPLEKHLLALKAAIYDTVLENQLECFDLEGFRLLERRDVRGSIHLDSPEDIKSVFSMTPYYYKTGVKDKEKLERIMQLDTEIEFGLFVYQKISSR